MFGQESFIMWFAVTCIFISASHFTCWKSGIKFVGKSMCFWTAYKLSQYCHLRFLCFGQFVLMPLCFQGEIFLFFCSLKCDQYEAICLFYALLYLLLRMPFGFAVVIHTSLITGDFSFYFSAYYWKKAQKFNVSLHAPCERACEFLSRSTTVSSTCLSLSNSSYHHAPPFPPGWDVGT